MLLKITEERVFSVNNRLIKQVGGWSMVGPISVGFWDIYVSEMTEEGHVCPMKPNLYKRHVDDTFIRKKKNKPDNIFEKLNF